MLTVLASNANTKLLLFELNGPLHVIFLATGSGPAFVDIDQLADVWPTVIPKVELEPNVAGDVAFNLILSVFCTVKDVVLKVLESFLETLTPSPGVTVTAVLMPVIVTVFDGHSTLLKLLVIGLNVIASGVVSSTVTVVPVPVPVPVSVTSTRVVISHVAVLPPAVTTVDRVTPLDDALVSLILTVSPLTIVCGVDPSTYALPLIEI